MKAFDAVDVGRLLLDEEVNKRCGFCVCESVFKNEVGEVCGDGKGVSRSSWEESD